MGFTLVSCVLFRTLPKFGDSKESVVLEGILEALMNQDSEELTRLCNDHVIKSLDTSVRWGYGGDVKGPLAQELVLSCTLSLTSPCSVRLLASLCCMKCHAHSMLLPFCHPSVWGLLYTLPSVWGLLYTLHTLPSVWGLLYTLHTLPNVWGLLYTLHTLPSVWGLLYTLHTLPSVWGLLYTLHTLPSVGGLLYTLHTLPSVPYTFSTCSLHVLRLSSLPVSCPRLLSRTPTSWMMRTSSCWKTKGMQCWRRKERG